MSHSSSITPAEHKIDLSISLLLAIIWGGLIIFGILTLMQPAWLVKISQPGRESEALDLKTMADNALTKGQYEQAVFLYERAIETDPELLTAAGNLAITYAKMGNLALAEKTLLAMAKKLPEREWVAFVNLADIYFERKQYDQAREYYLKSIPSSPFPGNAYKLAAFCSKNLGETDIALKYYSDALLIKNDFEALLMGSLKRDHFNFRKNEEHLNTIETLMKIQSIEDNIGFYDKTIFDYLLNRDPDIAKIYNELGVIYFHHGDIELAGRCFRNAISIDPGNRQARQNMGLINK
jgi:tetratricopeptide (TPR) repeat protein